MFITLNLLGGLHFRSGHSGAVLTWEAVVLVVAAFHREAAAWGDSEVGEPRMMELPAQALPLSPLQVPCWPAHHLHASVL
jgi:hypothetical protein